MKPGKPKAMELGHLRIERDLFTGIPQWPQVIQWQREGIVSIKPLAADRALVSLTDKGRKVLES